MFAPLVLFHFIGEENMDQKEVRQAVFKKMVKASLLAAGLLSFMYVGLTYLSSYYTPLLNSSHQPEKRLSLISQLVLGPQGALFASVAVALACLTTSIPLVSIFANYVREDFFKGKGGSLLPLILTLALSA